MAVFLNFIGCVLESKHTAETKLLSQVSREP